MVHCTVPKVANTIINITLININIIVMMINIREFDEAKEMLRAALEQSKHEQSFVVLGKVRPSA